MKKRNNRFLAGTLAGLMMLTMLPVTALAAQEGADDDAVSDTSNNIVNVVSDSENGQQAENNNVNAAANGTENGQKSADDSSGDNADTAAANQQEGEVGGSGSSGESASTPAAEPFVAKIVTETGTKTYDTLDAAIKAAENGDTIEIGNDDGVITVNEFEKNIIINGNGHTVTIPEQKTDNYSLNISGALTFNNTNVKCANNADMVKAWSIATRSKGVLTFDKGSTCTITKHGIYAHADSTINILGGSKLIIQNTTYTSMMADAAFANLKLRTVLRLLLPMHSMVPALKRMVSITSRLEL